jgi:hypothetical protein
VSTVQGSPSSQLTGLWTQPTVGSHESTVQALPSSQLIGCPPPQTPPVQVCPVRHRFPETHAVPSAVGPMPQTPAVQVAAWQVVRVGGQSAALAQAQ